MSAQSNAPGKVFTHLFFCKILLRCQDSKDSPGEKYQPITEKVQ